MRENCAENALKLRIICTICASVAQIELKIRAKLRKICA